MATDPDSPAGTRARYRRGPSRRRLLWAGAVGVAGAAAGGWALSRWRSDEGAFDIALSDDEWRERLTPEQFYVLRERGTEPPFSSPLNAEARTGLFACAGCGQTAYPSETKYDSGTGWPSFWAPIDEAQIGTRLDLELIYPRTEVHCSRCGGHFGHVFDDGPEPTGKRHCLNGTALAFRPAVGATTQAG